MSTENLSALEPSPDISDDKRRCRIAGILNILMTKEGLDDAQLATLTGRTPEYIGRIRVGCKGETYKKGYKKYLNHAAHRSLWGICKMLSERREHPLPQPIETGDCIAASVKEINSLKARDRLSILAMIPLQECMPQEVVEAVANAALRGATFRYYVPYIERQGALLSLDPPSVDQQAAEHWTRAWRFNLNQNVFLYAHRWLLDNDRVVSSVMAQLLTIARQHQNGEDVLKRNVSFRGITWGPFWSINEKIVWLTRHRDSDGVEENIVRKESVLQTEWDLSMPELQPKRWQVRGFGVKKETLAAAFYVFRVRKNIDHGEYVPHEYEWPKVVSAGADVAAVQAVVRKQENQR